MWKYEEKPLNEDEYTREPEKDWTLQNPANVTGAIKQVQVSYIKQQCNRYP